MINFKFIKKIVLQHNLEIKAIRELHYSKRYKQKQQCIVKRLKIIQTFFEYYH